MNRRLLLFPLACVLVSGCVTKTSVQSMIDSNNEMVINPRFEIQEKRVEVLEGQQQESRRLTETQRSVLIRHFELLRELSDKALSQLVEDGE